MISRSRVRPGEIGWPSEGDWARLKRQVGDRLIELESPLTPCRTAPAGEACADVLERLDDPYYLGAHPALTQASGYLDAWTNSASVYAVAAATTQDVVAAVNFARLHNLRLVVKGGGHSYQGTSNSADSLLVWTRPMDNIELHDAFVPQGGAGRHEPQPAVSVGAGAIWMSVYNAVTTRVGRYVQGGGCTTVGVAGIIQSGGFGSFSKAYGLAAAGLLEAEVVIADGAVRIANPYREPDLFWALKGGGGGSFGIVTRLTLRTRELPDTFGAVTGTIRAASDAAFRKLIAWVVGFYRERLFNPHWGEQIRFAPDNTVRIGMVFQGLSREQAANAWRPLLEWVTSAQRDLAWETPMSIIDLPARHFWDAAFLTRTAPERIALDDRIDARAGEFFWAGNREEAGQFLRGYRSAWLPESMLEDDRQAALADALFAGSRYWGISLHFNKGLAGATAAEREAASNCATNPVVVTSFALVIIAAIGPPAFPGTPGVEPDLTAANRNAASVNRAMDVISTIVPTPGSYVSESDFFERDWREAFWGSNYPRLAAVKRAYDPDGLFFTHRSVGSDEWSDDGFTRRETDGS
ncbi:MAG: FAD-binding oxidoreductase [Chloroflexota bacterium]|nr:FAD-binding oxidoreductase [Chloroflexota bacterium]